MTTIIDIQHQQFLIDIQLREFLDSLDKLELSSEDEQRHISQFANALFANSQERNDKLNATAWYVTKLIAEVGYNREHSQRLANRARVIENRAEALKAHLSYQVEQLGGKVKLADFNLSLRKSRSAIQIDNDFDGEIPKEYLKPQSVESRVSKVIIAQALKDGVKLPFAKLLSGGMSLFGLK